MTKKNQQQFEKSIKEEARLKKQLKEVQEQREAAHTALMADLGEQLVKQLASDDYEAIENFIKAMPRLTQSHAPKVNEAVTEDSVHEY